MGKQPLVNHHAAGVRMGSRNGNGGGNWIVPSLMAGGFTLLTVGLQAFSGLAYGTITKDQQRIEDVLSRRLATIEREFYRKDTHEEYVKGQRENKDAEIRRVDAILKKIDDRLDLMAPKSEVDARLGTNANALTQVRGEMDQLKRDLGNTYSVKDALAQLQQRLDRLDAWTRTMPTPSR